MVCTVSFSNQNFRVFRVKRLAPQDNNLRLNKDKCEFSKSEVSFYGHIFSSSGIKPDPKKVEAIHNASPPQNASDVKSMYLVSFQTMPQSQLRCVF